MQKLFSIGTSARVGFKISMENVMKSALENETEESNIVLMVRKVYEWYIVV